LDLLSDAMLHPLFPQSEVDKLLSQDIDGVKAAKDEAESVALTYYYGYLFDDHPYARPEGGDELSLARIKRDTIVKFYKANSTPGNTILAVTGEFKAPQMKTKLEEVFGAVDGEGRGFPRAWRGAADKRQEAVVDRQA
jgi:predicted Zn-dependent peptidase